MSSFFNIATKSVYIANAQKEVASQGTHLEMLYKILQGIPHCGMPCNICE